MKRLLAILSALLVAAAVAAVADSAPVPIAAPAPVAAARTPLPAVAVLEPPFASGPAAVDGARIAVTDADTLPAAPPVREVVFAMTGAPPGELAGTACVRRTDDTTAEHAFAGGRFAVGDPRTLSGVSLRVPGFAIAWPTLDRGVAEIAVPMQRSGTILVRLVDAASVPLADRVVRSLCQSAAPGAHGASCQANLHATTDARGVARIEHVLPGRHLVVAPRVAEWQAASAAHVVVEAGAVAACELAASTPATDRYGGFCFPLAAAPRLRVADHGVVDHVFATADGRGYELAVLGAEVRCIANGRQGDLVTGSIVPVVTDENGSRFGPPLCAPVTITVGAVVAIAPVWLRAR